MLNVHALGGKTMLRAAREAVPACAGSPKVIAVTLLTSMAEADLLDLGVSGTPVEVVSRLARLAVECGLDGVVCSAREAAHLRKCCGGRFCLVTPGIRPAAAAADDQQRVMTPAAAIAAGADYLVIGRPITRAPDPVAALRQINRELGNAAPRL
jgi:orotidine-5'-phosphate decarboxylase